jgi:hypothetical protein
MNFSLALTFIRLSLFAYNSSIHVYEARNIGVTLIEILILAIILESIRDCTIYLGIVKT